ncbi:MAG: 4-(cytidine 5'-diphospho)-2-C-methyl-D-erythritol kinase [Flavobacteriales bacterium]|nr:4-(cytidine 5'-diphospho)-2-C-methyl-D-erythritol kinase [Flavobacteriales bacterium]
MIVFPNAKINLGLNVLARRADGYNDIESILVPIPLHDVLEAVVDPSLAPNELVYTRSGLSIPGDPKTDLCYKAVRRIQVDRTLPGLRLHLHKVVPMGAGLGGGSSDGTHTLLLVNALCDLRIQHEQLSTIALELGSDCPFFLWNEVCIARGRGEQLTPIRLDLTGLWLVLANPGVHVSTGEVYKSTTPTNVPWDFDSIAHRDRMPEWNKGLRNTMEAYVLRNYAMVAELKEVLGKAGAAYATMSGSGSSVLGLFKDDPGNLSFPPGTSSWRMKL